MNAVIFDLDGTLWDATESLRAIWEREMHRIGIMRTVALEQMIGGMGLGPAELAAHMVPELPIEERVPFFEHVTSLEPDFICEHGARLYPGMVETLRELSKNHRVMIASNCVCGYIEGFLRYSGLGDAVCDFAHPGVTGLPKAGNIRLLMERNGIDRALMVGDTILDYEAAVGADVPFVFAAYGFGDVPQAQWRIETLRELPALAAEMLK